VASGPFAESERLRRFLRFTVEQTLQGQGGRIKEYLIGVEVFGREESFDPRTDPIVRVQAGKLRGRLEKYYATDGLRDPVLIEYPKGSYVPLFRKREPAAGRVSRSWRMLAAMTASLAVVGLASYWMVARRAATRAPVSGVPSIASIVVLPFTDLSPGKDQEFFCDGITEELINTLAKFEGLRVVARTSAFEFKGKGQDIRKIGAQLGVATVLEGSVRKDGGRLRVTVQLNNAADGFHLWSQTYDREMKDVFAIQEEVSRAVAETLRVRLAADGQRPLVRRYTGDLEVYNLYLTGLYHSNRSDPEGLKMAVKVFEQAIARNPPYAPAYAGLALAYYQLTRRSVMPPKEAMSKARHAAEKALEIDDTLADAYAALAVIRSTYDWDWKAAEREFQRALKLSPSHAGIRQAYCRYLLPMGRRDEALREIQRAKELDPLSLTVRRDLSRTYIERREFDRAIEECRRAIELDPSFYLVHASMGNAFTGQGSYTEAVVTLERACALSGRRDPVPLELLGYAKGVMGARAEARKLLDELQGLSKHGYVSPVAMATVCAGLGDKDQAFLWLNKAYAERAVQLNLLPGGFHWDILRSDPRFTTLLQKMGFGK